VRMCVCNVAVSRCDYKGECGGGPVQPAHDLHRVYGGQLQERVPLPTVRLLHPRPRHSRRVPWVGVTCDM
jgi:hypothetical protein